jgi:hypothetical protein
MYTEKKCAEPSLKDSAHNAAAFMSMLNNVKSEAKRNSMGIIYLFGVFDGAACAEEVLVTEGCVT